MRRFPYPPPYVDVTGKVKRDTLEYFLFHPGLHTAQQLTADPYLSAGGENGEAALQMRLLRYVHMGVLSRKKRSRTWEYELTWRGEQRILWLWDQALDKWPTLEITQEEREIGRKEIEHRIGGLQAFLAGGIDAYPFKVP